MLESRHLAKGKDRHRVSNLVSGAHFLAEDFAKSLQVSSSKRICKNRVAAYRQSEG